MNTKEAFQLLTLASARDGRTVDTAVASVWADDLSDVTLAEAVDAMRYHFRESKEYFSPVHVVKTVRSRRNDAVERRRLTPADGRAVPKPAWFDAAVKAAQEATRVAMIAGLGYDAQVASSAAAAARVVRG